MFCSGEGSLLRPGRPGRKEEVQTGRLPLSYPRRAFSLLNQQKHESGNHALCLICHIKENGSKGECFWVSLWGNASLNTSWTAALNRAANRDIEVLSFARSYWIRAVRNAETERVIIVGSSLLPDGLLLGKLSFLQTFPVAQDIRRLLSTKRLWNKWMFINRLAQIFFFVSLTITYIMNSHRRTIFCLSFWTTVQYWKWTLFLSVYSAWGSCCQVD